jgi:hypothetical protein
MQGNTKKTHCTVTDLACVKQECANYAAQKL